MRLSDSTHQQRGIFDQDIMDLLAPPPRQPRQVDPATAAWEERQRQWKEKRDAERLEWERDPLAAERNQWDDSRGDVGHHPDIEWVPTAHLKQFIEFDRRPGRTHAIGSPERYEELASHIREHGFRNPVVLEYNPDTGHAHMGEGNHRTWIALEHGIPAMPVRVYRSRRESPTKVPVELQHRPEWEDFRGQQHIPDSLKPSHIGLPTVPEPSWQKRASRR